MKKVINGRMYNTETAKEVCFRTRLYNGNNVSGWVTLFKKKTGEFFFHNLPTGWDLFNQIEYIEPTGEVEAKEFAEQNMDGDAYEKIFGEVLE